LAEITNDTGDAILPQAYGALQENNTPQLWLISKSKHKWPTQSLPSTKTWNLWKKFLKSLLNERKKLKQPLGMWYTNHGEYRQWTTVTDGKVLVRKIDNTNRVFKQQETRSRHTLTYTLARDTTVTSNTPFLPITPISINDTIITC
jgi:hypothetical protein